MVPRALRMVSLVYFERASNEINAKHIQVYMSVLGFEHLTWCIVARVMCIALQNTFISGMYLEEKSKDWTISVISSDRI